jgi:hypothetical protein
MCHRENSSIVSNQHLSRSNECWFSTYMTHVRTYLYYEWIQVIVLYYPIRLVIDESFALNRRTKSMYMSTGYIRLLIYLSTCNMNSLVRLRSLIARKFRSDKFVCYLWNTFLLSIDIESIAMFIVKLRRINSIEHIDCLSFLSTN